MILEIELTEKNFQDVKDVLSDYYSIVNVSDDIIFKMFQNNLNILGEVRDGCATDTMVRGDIIREFLKQINIDSDWPCNGDTVEYKELFYKNLRERCKQLDIKFE